MGYLKASKTFGVPRATLERKVKCIDTPLSELVNVFLGRKPILPSHIEADLVSNIIEMGARLFGLTCTDVRRILELTSAARATAFNKLNVGKFFDPLEKEVDLKKFKAHHIYNVDEKPQQCSKPCKIKSYHNDLSTTILHTQNITS